MNVELLLTANTRFAQLTSTALTVPLAGKGEPATGVMLPVVEMEKTATEFNELSPAIR